MFTYHFIYDIVMEILYNEQINEFALKIEKYCIFLH